MTNNTDQSLNIPDALQSALRHHQKGELQKAEAVYRQILRADKGNADALHLLGVIAYQSGRNTEAIELIGKAICVNQNVPIFHNNLGLAFHGQGKLEEAMACYSRALSLNPVFPEAYNNLGNVFQGQGKSEEAIACFNRALSLNPGYPEAHNNLGNMFKEQGKSEEAIACYSRALSLNPGYPESHNNLGAVFKEQGKLEEARACFNRAMSLKPDYPEARFNSGLLSLLQGDFEEGWRSYEYRRSFSDIKHLKCVQPQWHGGDAGDKTILIWAEQGFGDMVQFIRYVSLVSERCGKVIVECQKELVSIIRRINLIDKVVERGDQIPDFDFHCPVMTLPLLLKTDIETIPAAIPYINIDPEKISDWRRRIGVDNGGFKVGLCWAGNPRHKYDRSRSLSLEKLSPLSELEGVVFYSLQKGKAVGQMKEAQDIMGLVDYTDHLNDFSDTAALIENLDLVISVDTAVVHLAGAMGKRVWTLLPYIPDWRWLLYRSDSPWYPSMRLFRQPEYGDWDSVIKLVRDELAQFKR